MTIIKRATLTLLLLSICTSMFAQKYTVSGTILEKGSSNPVSFATIILKESEQWAVADAEGRFSISAVASGTTTLSVSCLGYASYTKRITVDKDIKLSISLSFDNLALESAVVSAKEKEDATTTRSIDRTALDHIQLMNVSDISSLLPGGATVNASLTSEQSFNIRGENGEGGNSSFGTAVEIDGVRLSNNASFSGASSSSTNLKGVSTNNISSSSIESIEVITGVPSVEYGDMTSGIVKINTRHGKSPWNITMSTNPSIKQISVSKGFSLSGKSQVQAGVLNASAELTRSISEPMSPYTAYNRRGLNLNYSNTLSKGAFAQNPLSINFGISGNIGGLNTEADPDAAKETFTRKRDNSFRTQLNLDWMVNEGWLKNIVLNASMVYSDKLTRSKEYYSSASSTAALHGTDEGYFMAKNFESGDNSIINIAPGYWYNTMILDDKPVNAKVTLKANLSKKFGKINNKMKAGLEWNMDKNLGKGQYSEDMATAPTYRNYDYSRVPMMSNFSAYLEENLMIPAGKEGRINLIAGLRSDNTLISGSKYGLTSSISPRINARYIINDKIAIRASWGVAVKQPSFAVLYPEPSYQDVNIFTSTANGNNDVLRAYYILPRTLQYNPALRWQKSQQSEAGIELNFGGNKFSFAGFYNRTLNAYSLITDYSAFSYNYTSLSAVQKCEIPDQYRIYSIDKANGAVYVNDSRGILPTSTLEYTTRNQLTTTTTEGNNSKPITRWGLEWVMDFAKIKAINTSIRFDGSWYNYRNLLTDIRAYSPYSTNGVDGKPYKYVGYYVGGNSVFNGTQTSSVKTNLTFTTHIPRVRLIITLKLEATLMKHSQSLSERSNGKERSSVISDRSDILSTTPGSIYNGDLYTVLYPEYYVSLDKPDYHRNYIEDLMWAKENDSNMFKDLSKLAITSSYSYIFKPDYISPYFSCNFSVTKEIGNIASISFYANNFFNSMAQVYSSKTGTYASVTTYIPKFYYGLTLRFKF